MKADTVRRSFAAHVTPLALDAEVYEQLKHAGAVTVTGFPLDAATQVDLTLHRFEILTKDARIVMGTPRGDVPNFP